jgi:hypothetical protein
VWLLVLLEPISATIVFRDIGNMASIRAKWLMGKAEALCRVLGPRDGEYDGQKDKDTGEEGGRGFID